ncbi:MAG: hypothetical protein A2044_01455 [Candidatus Firestonebacteria bacterium GWA2_43_8]|nr:MAG: hypothetical protein A2044_01455 [Candidatus Firestonebacteria bacterium GWA2_43_8]
MYLNDALEKVFSNPSKIKILRFLCLYRPEVTGRELSQFVGISHTQVQNALSELEEEGLVLYKRAGRSGLHRLNLNNEFVVNILQDLFRKEKDFAGELLRKYLKPVFGWSLSVILFGSVRRKEERGNSDIDVFILTKDAGAKKEVEEKCGEIAVEMLQTTGNRLSPLVLTIKEYKKEKAAKKAVLTEIEAGELIYGEKVKQALKGEQNDTEDTKKAKREKHLH